MNQCLRPESLGRDGSAVRATKIRCPPIEVRGTRNAESERDATRSHAGTEVSAERLQRSGSL